MICIYILVDCSSKIYCCIRAIQFQNLFKPLKVKCYIDSCDHDLLHPILDRCWNHSSKLNLEKDVCMAKSKGLYLMNHDILCKA